MTSTFSKLRSFTRFKLTKLEGSIKGGIGQSLSFLDTVKIKTKKRCFLGFIRKIWYSLDRCFLVRWWNLLRESLRRLLEKSLSFKMVTSCNIHPSLQTLFSVPGVSFMSSDLSISMLNLKLPVWYTKCESHEVEANNLESAEGHCRSISWYRCTIGDKKGVKTSTQPKHGLKITFIIRKGACTNSSEK